MTEIGLFLSSEEHGPKELVSQARMVEAAGMSSVLISDHFHPWLDRQGNSPFVWTVIGGIASTTTLKVTTGVTCPIVRIHPVILAQATATCQLMLEGRFVFGVGTGEALNEHVTGAHWPPISTRLEMLEESLSIIRQLWEGRMISHRGVHYTVENARIYSCPDEPPPILVSAFGPQATEAAARMGDGLITTKPDPSAVECFRKQGGGGLAIAATKVCWDTDESRARKLAHELWRTESLPGQLNQELPLPSQFEESASLVTEDMVASSIPCGPDPEKHVQAIRGYLDAGFDEVYVNQIGSDLEGFLGFLKKDLLPRLSL
jgi:G6PDH family F420-dependent oxidoreductase